MNFLKGKRTFIVGIGSILFGVGGLVTGSLEFSEGARFVLEGLTAIGIRLAID